MRLADSVPSCDARPWVRRYVLLRRRVGKRLARAFGAGRCRMGGVGVYDGGGEPRDDTHELRLALVRDGVGVGEARRGVDLEVGIGVDLVADPPHPDPAHPAYPVDPDEGGLGLFDEFGSMPSMRRRNTSREAVRRTRRIATVMTSPMTGSAQPHPMATPPALTTTASEVSPSVRAWWPSATSAAEPMALPSRIRNSATASLPRKPMRPAAATQPRLLIGVGSTSRSMACQPATSGRERDHREDEQAGEVLRAPVAVGVPPGGGPTTDDERDPQWDRRQGVGEVVDGVGEQGHRPRDGHDPS